MGWAGHRAGTTAGDLPWDLPTGGTAATVRERERGWHRGELETRGRDKQDEMWSQGRKEEASLPQGSSWCGHRAP